ncbi:hypothetical protein LXL04_027536 [Taraxacum kok-saghyz]
MKLVVECCGSPAIIRRSNTDRNPGRLFYACSKHAPQCGFLGWVDDEKTKKSFNQKDLIIEQLVLENEKLKKWKPIAIMSWVLFFIIIVYKL